MSEDAKRRPDVWVERRGRFDWRVMRRPGRILVVQTRHLTRRAAERVARKDRT